MSNPIIKPLAWKPVLFLCCLLLSMPPVVIFAKAGVLPAAAYVAIAVSVSYLMTALVYVARLKVLRAILGGVLCVVLAAMAVIDCFSISTFGEELNQVHVGLVYETNIKESVEFILHYLKFTHVLLLAVLLIAAVCAVVFGLRLLAGLNSKLGRLMAAHGKTVSAFVVVCFIVGVANISYAEKYPLKRVGYFFNYTSYPDLADHLVRPKIVSVSASHPSRVVIIIGESFTRSHSSMYGYGMKTNPRLQALKDSGELFTFDNVTSLGTKTVRSLKSILSTYREDETNWWEHLTMIEFLKASGYPTYWKSNQARSGIHEVLATQYSKLCDGAQFVGELPGNKGYDGELLQLNADSAVGRKAVIYHLMGSHAGFASRYPSDFKGFSEEEYASVPGHQRREYATYDTSVLYNDSIVSDIMTRYADDDAVVVYFPDHGLDFYDTSDTYCGHAKNFKESLEIGRKIPFMIYATRKYQNAHPEIVEAMKRNEHKKWCISETIYTLMKLTGYEVEDDDEIEKYSLL